MTKNRPDLFELATPTRSARRRIVFGAALGAGSAAIRTNAFAQGSVPRASAPVPAPSAPEGDWRSKEAADAERKRLEKIRIEDERLAKLPRDQRVLRPKSIEIDGKKYVELDMYGTRFRIPREYVGQLPPDGKFVDGHFWWPQKIAVKDPEAAKYYPPFPTEYHPAHPEFGKEIEKRNSYIVQYRIAADARRIEGVLLERSRTAQRNVTQQIANSEIKNSRQIGADAIEFIGQANLRLIRQMARDVRSPDEDELVLRERGGGRTDDQNTTFSTGFVFKGVSAAYIVSRRLVPEWKEIHAEVLRLLNVWTKE